MDDTSAIEEAEGRLRAAMLAGDTDALDALLDPDTVFTDQAGVRMGKAEDLAAHRSGLLRIERIEPLAPALVRVLGDAAIVAVTVAIAGRYAEQGFGGRFAYTRLWHRGADGQWRVAAAHCSAVADA